MALTGGVVDRVYARERQRSAPTVGCIFCMNFTTLCGFPSFCGVAEAADVLTKMDQPPSVPHSLPPTRIIS